MHNCALPDQTAAAADSAAPEPLRARPQILKGATETLALRLRSWSTLALAAHASALCLISRLLLSQNKDTQIALSHCTVEK
jgi:hypothetical protein